MASPAKSTAQVTWEGTLAQGKGHVSLGSGALSNQEVTWAGRTERGEKSERTSPEELIAGAHAACYAMAFSHLLATQGTPATRLDVSATCTFAPKQEGGWEITTMDLEVQGTVAGMDQEAFAAAAQKGEQSCPVSNALRNNVQITVMATLV